PHRTWSLSHHQPALSPHQPIANVNVATSVQAANAKEVVVVNLVGLLNYPELVLPQRPRTQHPSSSLGLDVCRVKLASGHHACDCNL
ncbi:hypothetical protein HaLaN_17136, partial [Haematococcus lacustris]